MRTVCLGALVAVMACSSSEVRTCDDSLAGIWTDAADDSRRYHMVTNRGGYEMYALFDTTRPTDGSAKAGSPVIDAPVVFDFQRSGATYEGTRTQRRTRGPRVCTPRTRATITRCGGNSLDIDIERPGELDWKTCERAPSPGTDRLHLER